MLHEFLTSNRQMLIRRCSDKVAKRFEPSETAATINHGVPLFLQQLVETLREEQTTTIRDDGSAATTTPSKIGRTAALHGAELLRLGFTVDQVVHDYGDVCQSITALAVEQEVFIAVDEFRTLNRCLDNAIADAVTAFGAARQTSLENEAVTLQSSLAAYSTEHRRLVDIAEHSLAAIRTGNIGISGATGALLAHALEELRSLPDRTLPHVSGAPPGTRAGASSSASTIAD